MLAAAEELKFEQAAALRDQISKLKKIKDEAEKIGLPRTVKRSEVEKPGTRGGSSPAQKPGMPAPALARARAERADSLSATQARPWSPPRVRLARSAASRAPASRGSALRPWAEGRWGSAP